uniref:Uncharacterized protein n=1 Tax=Brassica campestris TaxID=3711 RepID=A0A3P6DBG8_BRACM|nr:unnamed protein product [Brassica rapa]
MPQSEELDHQEDQDIPTEVHRPSRTDQQGRAVYRIDPRTDGKKLRLDPRPISRTDRTGSSFSQTTRQSQTDGLARSNLGRAGQGTGRDFSLLAHLEHTGRMDELIDQFDQFMDFDHPNLSKAQILHLSEDLGRLWSKMARKMDKSERTDQPATVLILTAVQPAGHKPAEGVRTKLLEPPEVLSPRTRACHAPPPEIVSAALAAVLQCRTPASQPPDRRLATARPLPRHRRAAAGRCDSPVTR